MAKEKKEAKAETLEEIRIPLDEGKARAATKRIGARNLVRTLAEQRIARRVDPELGRLIRNRASMNRRSIQQELLHLIETRLNVDERGFSRLLLSHAKRRRKAVA